MAKGNNKKENFLDGYVKRIGSLDFITPKDVQHNAIRIFKDIAYGNIDQKDIDKYQAFFLNNTNIDNLLIVAQNKRDEAAIHCNAMEALLKVNPDAGTNQLVPLLHRKDYTVYTLYSTIFDTFSGLKAYGDIRILYGLQHSLVTMRRYFNNI